VRTIEFSGVEQKVDVGQLKLRTEHHLVAGFSSVLLFGEPRRPYRSTTSFVSTMEDGCFPTDTLVARIVGATSVL
jgi:hypothetical protein